MKCIAAIYYSTTSTGIWNVALIHGMYLKTKCYCDTWNVVVIYYTWTEEVVRYMECGGDTKLGMQLWYCESVTTILVDYKECIATLTSYTRPATKITAKQWANEARTVIIQCNMDHWCNVVFSNMKLRQQPWVNMTLGQTSQGQRYPRRWCEVSNLPTCAAYL